MITGQQINQVIWRMELVIQNMGKQGRWGNRTDRKSEQQGNTLIKERSTVF